MMAVGNRKGEGLTKQGKCGKISADGRWISCPACGNGKLLWIRPEATAHHFPVYCKRCRGYVEINID